ncbi:probable Kelch-like protein 17 [Coccomyxa sp. Obi]|nr:probable Kelch-like protein 17 [Coccomyxa sp. Obi]
MRLLVCLALGCLAIAQGAQAQQETPTSFVEPLTGVLGGAANVGQQLVGHIVNGTENVLGRAEKKIESLFPLKQTSNSMQPAATTTPVILTSTPPSTAGAASTTAQASTLPPTTITTTTSIAAVASTPPPTTLAASTTTSSLSSPPSTTVAASTSYTPPSTTVAASTPSIPLTTTQAATTQPPSTTQIPLQNYTVLAAGGSNFDSADFIDSAELYSSTTGDWTATGALTTPQALYNIVRLLDGQALLAGGLLALGTGADNPATNTTQLYNATSGSWAKTGEMTTPRTSFQMVVLQNGDVLAAGGCVDLYVIDPRCDTQASAEVFSPSTGTWTPTGSMTTPRVFFQMVALPDNTVLAAGGFEVVPPGTSGTAVFLNSSEIYDPMTGKWTSTGSMSTPRGAFQMVVLPNGTALAAGGTPDNLNTATPVSLNSSEIYDPATGRWTATGSMLSGRVQFQMVRLLNGNALAVNGIDYSTSSSLKSAEVYDYNTGMWSATGALYDPPGRTGRSSFSMVALPDGNALAASGYTQSTTDPNDIQIVTTSEVYSPATGNWTETGPLMTGRTAFQMVVL